MRGVANEHDATAMPAIELKPFNRSAMDRVIALQSGQVVLDKAAEPGEPALEALQPTMLGIAKARRRHVRKTVSAAADRTKAEEAAIAQPELNAVGSRRGNWRQTTPHHLSAIVQRALSE